MGYTKEDFKPGDKVTYIKVTETGNDLGTTIHEVVTREGIVKSIDNHHAYPIVAEVAGEELSFKANNVEYNNHHRSRIVPGTVKIDSLGIHVTPFPVQEPEFDEVIEVKEGEKWVRRHFKCMHEGGKVLCFLFGKSSKTSINQAAASWSEWRRIQG